MQSWIFSIITPVKCHMIFQKSFGYAALMLKKRFLLFTINVKTVVLFNIFVETMNDLKD